MAVIDECPGVKAEVDVERRPLREYDDEEEEKVPNVVTKYIEAQSGKEFTIKWVFSPPFQNKYGVRVGVKIDGEKPNFRVYPPEDLFRPGGHLKVGVGFKKEGEWFRRNYRFTSLNIVEDIADKSRMSELRRDAESKGCITLTFWYINNMTRDVRAPRGFSNDYLKSMGDLPEKALKGDARSHQTTLGEKYSIPPRKPGWEYDVVSTRPFATFHFKYRSRSALKALRIIRDEDSDANADADAVPLEKRPEDQMTAEELRETVRRMRRREEVTRPVKQESTAEPRVKREREIEVGSGGDDDEVTIVETRQKRPRRDPEVIVLD